jgi:hypothetical protein
MTYPVYYIKVDLEGVRKDIHTSVPPPYISYDSSVYKIEYTDQLSTDPPVYHYKRLRLYIISD